MCLTALALAALSAPGHGATPATTLQPLSSTAECNRCAGFLLPGRFTPHPESFYRIDSDLPEIILSIGTLYSTRAVLPPMHTKDGRDIPESQRTQRAAPGLADARPFTAIDDSFEVFFYHMSNPAPDGMDARHGPQIVVPGDTRSRRVVVLATNTGPHAVDVRPRQIVEADGTMAKVDGPESRLAVRMLEDDWDRPLESVRIAPGQSRVIAYSQRLSVPGDQLRRADGTPDPDATASDFVSATVRAEVSHAPGEHSGGQRPALQVCVVAVPSDIPLGAALDRAAAAQMDRGARSGEGAMDLTIPPPACHVRRVVGVFENFLWTADPITLDASTLSEHRGGLFFLMALPRVQSVGCESARQTRDMLRHPGFVHADTIGNYQIETLLTLTLENRSDKPRRVDLRFGKQDADIGLAWQIHVSEPTPLSAPAAPRTRDQLASLPALVQWAGGWRKDDLPDNTRSLLLQRTRPHDASPNAAPDPLGAIATGEADLITVEPGRSRVVSIRLMVVGTSSLPYHIHVVDADASAPK